MPTLDMRGITKRFFGVEVLHGVDFSVDKGEIFGLCGENGAGKSTLMKILAGIHNPDSGDITFKDIAVRRNATPQQMQHLGVSMIHQELDLLGDLTVAQNIFLCREPLHATRFINFNRMNEEASVILERLGEKIDPRRRVRDLKIAQKQVVEIAKAISFNVELLVMDEPTAVLTGRETAILFDLISQLSSQGIAIVYISHRLKELIDVCHKVTVLRDGSVVATRDIAEVTAQDIAALMVGREITQESARDFAGDTTAPALEVDDVSDDLLKGVGFKVHRGEILGFSGLIGAGRSELMEVIFGIRKPKTGSVRIDGKKVSIKSAIDAIKVNLGFVTEDRKETGLVLCRDITENANYVGWLKNRGFFKGKKSTTEKTRNMIDRLAIRCSGPGQSVSNLSGGNQQKVALAKWLLSGASILVLDEPTRGVDVGARQEIYRIIRELAADGVAVIIVSSDLPEILGICQRVIIMHEGTITGTLRASEMTEEKIMYYATDV